MKGMQAGAKWSMIIHRRLIKPPYPVQLKCPGCGRTFVEVNSDVVMISNDFGLPPKELKAIDVWSRIRHNCGTTIVLYWHE